MPGTVAPLRIEIIDPVAEPPSGGFDAIAVISGEPPSLHPTAWAPLIRARVRVERRLAPTWSRIERWERRGTELMHRLGRRRVQLVFDGSPRRDSRVRQHVFVPFAEVQRHLPGETTVVVAGSGRLEVTTPFEPVPGGAVRAGATLRLRGSWPALPLWITVEPWWRSRTIATVSLRSTRRVRYPRRYFGAAHAAVRELSELVARDP